MKCSARSKISTLLLLVLLLTAAAPMAEASDITLYINGVLIRPDVPPFLLNNRTLVPVRVIAERLGADVQWDQSQMKVTIVRDQATLVLWIGSSDAMVNDRKVILDTEPIIRDGRTMVPVRFISERLGAQVNWDGTSRSVYVDSSPIKLTSVAYRDGEQWGSLVLETNSGATFVSSASADGTSILVNLPGTAAGIPVGTRTVNQGGVRQTVVRVNSDGSAQVRIDLESGQIWQENVTENAYTLVLPRMVKNIRLEDYQGLDAVTVDTGGWTRATTMMLEEPQRAVLDLSTAVLLQSGGTVELEHAFIQRIRFAQHDPDKVRVVADLEAAVPYRLVAQERQVRMVFAARVQEVIVEDGDSGAHVTVVADNGMAVQTPIGNTQIAWVIPDAVWAEGGQVRYRQNGLEQAVWSAAEVTATRSVSGASVESLQIVPTSSQGLTVYLNMKRSSQDIKVVRDSRSQVRMQVTSTPPPPLSGRIIAIDPGHGGSEPGAVGPQGTTEKEVNLAVALKLREMLLSQGATVVMTRDKDVGVTLTERARLANTAKADIFISIHANGFYLDTANGTETFYNPDNHPDSGLLGQHVHREMVAKVGLRDRGLKTATYTVLRETAMPSVLVEVAFLTNPAEEILLKDPAFQQKAAQGIAQGVLTFFAQCR